MGRNMTVPADAFASGLSELLGDLPVTCSEGLEKAVTQSTRKGVKAVKGYASSTGVHEWSGEYVDGFTSRVTKGLQPTGEIGNKAKPGLVHLLEKGHATLTGRKTRAFPHMAPAFDDIKDDFVKLAEKYVGEALR